MDKYLIGDTLKFTWVSSGDTPSPIVHSLIDGAEVVVSSGAMTSSGNGHYYRLTSVQTPGYYVSETLATVEGNVYKRRIKFKAIRCEVD